jgi:hypothetical protein
VRIFVHPFQKGGQKAFIFWCVCREQSNLCGIVQISLHYKCCLALVDDYEEVVGKCRCGHYNCSFWNFSKISPSNNQHEASLKKIVVQVGFKLV